MVLSQPNLAWECIKIPHNPGPPCQIQLTNYEWAWTVKQISARGSGRMGGGELDCKNQQLKLPNGETMC